MERICSGPDFYRLNWDVIGAVDRTTQSPVELTNASATTTLKYALSRAVVISGLFGYESITSNQALSRSLVGPIAKAGFQLIPNRNLQLSAQAGWQYNRPSYTGDFRYQIGPFTS